MSGGTSSIIMSNLAMSTATQFVEDSSDDIQIVQEVLTYPRSLPGIRTFNYQSPTPLPVAGPGGGVVDGTYPKHESVVISPRQNLNLFGPIAAEICQTSLNLKNAGRSSFVVPALAPPLPPLPPIHQYMQSLDGIDDGYFVNEYEDTFLEKENLYENHVMHGSHFLCGDFDLMPNGRDSHVSDMNSSTEIYDMDESMDILVPEIEINISDGLVHLPNEVENGSKERRLVVKLEKYYYCSKCKHNCFFTPNLLNHFKHCSKLISADINYNQLKPNNNNNKLTGSGRPPAVIPTPPSEREVFIINGTMIKCDIKILMEDLKLRQRPFVKLSNGYYCQGCDKRFELGSTELAFHLKRRTPCLKPPKKTKGRPKSQKSQTKQSPKKVIYECEICEIKYKDETELAQHVKLVHNGVTKYKCTFCKMIFAELNTKMEHIVFNHLAVVPSYARFKCRHCARRFYNAFLRDTHQKTHIPDNTMYKCTTCSRSFKVFRSFKVHTLKHGKDFDISCTDCPDIFTKKIDYLCHLRSVHNIGVDPTRLQVLGQSQISKPCVTTTTIATTTTTALQPEDDNEIEVIVNHINKPINPLNPPSTTNNDNFVLKFKCTTCFKVYSNLTYLRLHTKKHGSSAGFEFGCNDCPETFSKKIPYVKHLLLVHKRKINLTSGHTQANKNSVEVLIDSIPDLEESVCNNIGVEIVNLDTKKAAEKEENDHGLQRPALPVKSAPALRRKSMLKSTPISKELDVEILMDRIPKPKNFDTKKDSGKTTLRRSRSTHKVIEVIEIESD